MIRGHDLELFDRSLEHATATSSGPALDAALAGLGWRDAFAEDPRVAVSRLFELQGAANATSSALEWVQESDVSLGQLAVGHELVGASRRMLALAREHAVERIQFGQPIAMFQAVRHRLAETLVAIEAADAALDAAWLDRSPVTAAIAKAMCGRAGLTTARHCQQVLAGIGFTTEHPFHRYLKRVLLLDQLLGSTHVLTRELGAQIIATGSLPPVVPL